MKTYSDSINKMKREPIEIKRPLVEKQKFIGDEVVTKSEFSRQLQIIQRNLNSQTQNIKQMYIQKAPVSELPKDKKT